MTDKPKAHHFVQFAYLEEFCDPVPNEKTGARFLWIHEATKKVRRQSPKECAVENYFYCHNDEFGERQFLGENFLADLESVSSEVLKAAQHGVLPKSLRERLTLTGYVAMSLSRTPAAKRRIDQSAIDQTIQQIRELINDPKRHAEYCAKQERETGEKIDPEESKKVLKAGKVRAVQTNRAWSLRQMAEMIMHFQSLFMNMRLFLIHANEAFFLTSDHPVRVHDPSSTPAMPLGFQRLEMLFPLSKDYCLAGTYSPGPEILEFRGKDVININKAIIRHSDRFVYAPFDADYIQSELQESLAKRLKTQGDGIIRFF